MLLHLNRLWLPLICNLMCDYFFLELWRNLYLSLMRSVLRLRLCFIVILLLLVLSLHLLWWVLMHYYFTHVLLWLSHLLLDNNMLSKWGLWLWWNSSLLNHSWWSIPSLHDLLMMLRLLIRSSWLLFIIRLDLLHWLSSYNKMLLSLPSLINLCLLCVQSLLLVRYCTSHHCILIYVVINRPIFTQIFNYFCFFNGNHVFLGLHISFLHFKGLFVILLKLTCKWSVWKWHLFFGFTISNITILFNLASSSFIKHHFLLTYFWFFHLVPILWKLVHWMLLSHKWWSSLLKLIWVRYFMYRYSIILIWCLYNLSRLKLVLLLSSLSSTISLLRSIVSTTSIHDKLCHRCILPYIHHLKRLLLMLLWNIHIILWCPSLLFTLLVKNLVALYKLIHITLYLQTLSILLSFKIFKFLFHYVQLSKSHFKFLFIFRCIKLLISHLLFRVITI